MYQEMLTSIPIYKNDTVVTKAWDAVQKHVERFASIHIPYILHTYIYVYIRAILTYNLSIIYVRLVFIVFPVQVLRHSWPDPK